MNHKKSIWSLHLYWAWISLALNEFIAALIYFVYSRDNRVLLAGLGCLVLTVLSGIRYVRRNEPFSKFHIISQYVLNYLLSLMIILCIYKYTSYSSIHAMIIMVVAIVIESVVIIAIQYCYQIINWLKKKR